MIQKAMEEFDIDIENSVIIGDRDDMEGEMGRKLMMNYFILKRSTTDSEWDFVFSSIKTTFYNVDKNLSFLMRTGDKYIYT